MNMHSKFNKIFHIPIFKFADKGFQKSVLAIRLKIPFQVNKKL